jgi:hypothetical protein
MFPVDVNPHFFKLGSVAIDQSDYSMWAHITSLLDGLLSLLLALEGTMGGRAL